MFLYLDESGDLGFDWSKQGTSPYFTITILVCESLPVSKGFRVAVKRTLRQKFNKRKHKRLVQELKGTATTLEIKQYFLKHAPENGWGIYSVTLNKKRVNVELQTKQGKQKFYNFLARFLIDNLPLGEAETVYLVLDKCKNKEEIADFNHYIEQHLQGRLPLNTPLYISHESSQDNPCLQAVDLFCWGIARNWRDKDSQWFKEFAGYIRRNEMYLPDKRGS